MAEASGFDAFSPAQIALRVEALAVAKSRLPLLSLVMLGGLAGAFIGLGSMFYVIVIADPSLGFATKRLLGGAVFSLGLFLVVVAGAELFTGNNLIVIAWAERKLTTAEVLFNWLVVCLANFAGALGLAALVFLSGHTDMNNGGLRAAYLQIGAAKTALPFLQAFFSGVMCNVLVCLAVWMTLAGRSVIDKLAAVMPPVAAFVAAGFEHSIANMYLIPMAMLLQAAAGEPVQFMGLARNLVPVIAGNLVGGSVLVGLVYHLIYRLPATAGGGSK